MKHLYLPVFLAAFVFTGCTNNNLSDISLNVMTFNVRYDNPHDSLNAWTYRKVHAANCIAFYGVDIAGLQEALRHQIQDFTSCLPDYGYLGVGRDDGKERGEYSAILYNKKRLDVLKNETFWLSEHPETPGEKGWDAACPRVVTWALLRDKASGKEFYVFNTHFDHIGKTARRESSKMLLTKVKEIAQGKNAIITGDFNATADDEVIEMLTDKTNPDSFTDTRTVAPIRYGADYTWHGFGRGKSRSIIDFIFVKGNNIKVRKNGILSEKPDNTYLSDHNPVLCTLNVE